MEFKLKRKSLLFTALLFLGCVSFAFGAGQWVAKVDGKVINDKELKAMLKQQQTLVEVIQGRNMSSQFQNKRFQGGVLQMQIQLQLMVDEIKNINKTKKFVSEKSINSEANKLMKELKKSLWLTAYRNKILRPQITISDKAVNHFYTNNKDKFKGASLAEAKPLIKEQLILQEMQPLLAQLQTKIKTEHDVIINKKYFQ